MINIKTGSENIRIKDTDKERSLLDILRESGYNLYAPCGGKGKCGKCMVSITGEGNVMACSYYPEKDIEVILPGKDVGNILVSQTEFLEDFPFKSKKQHFGTDPYGVAVDIGTTTVVLYFLNLLSGKIGKIASFLNPQNIYGADVISRISYCQENKNGLKDLQNVIVNAINNELDNFISRRRITSDDFENMIIAGNTTMLHLFLGEDPVSSQIKDIVHYIVY